MVTQTVNKLSRELKSVVREVLNEEKQEENELKSIVETLEQLNQKVNALAAKGILSSD